MSLGELHAASGKASKSFFVRISYFRTVVENQLEVGSYPISN